MTSTTAESAPEFVDQSAAAKFLTYSPRTLEALRTNGRGPRFYKIGRKVLYAVADLRAFVEQGARTSTSDTGSKGAK